MALVLADRVQQTGTANTTVSFTLSASVTGFQTFAVIGNGNTTYYTATDASGNWEVGLGTYTTAGPTLTRTTIYSSSNSNAAVSTFGAVTVFVTYPAEQAIYEDANNVLTVNSPLSYSDTGIIASFASTVAGYNQIVLQNKDSGTGSSTNFNVSNNNGTSSTNYGEFGINSSTYTGSGSFGLAGATYVAAASTDLVMGTYGNTPIHFVINSGATDAMTISTAGDVTTPNTLTGSKVVASNGLFVNSLTVSASYSIPSGSSAMSTGPITVSSGVAVTVPSGSKWVIL